MTIPSSVASTRPPSARSAAVTVATRSDSLRRSSAASAIVVVPSAKQAASAASGSSSIASGTSPPPISVPRSRAARARTVPAGSPPRSPSTVASTPAPIRSRIVSRPVRVGLRPTPVRVTSLPGTSSAPTRKKAAEEKSAGTAIRPPCRRSVAAIATVCPARLSSAPAAFSIRSLWSRLGIGSTTRVSPSATRPAKSRQDLTWALAIGSSYSIPVSGAPAIASGGRRSSRQERSAPIDRSGPTMRSTGRSRIESSPSSSQVPPGWPASQPGSSLSRVPALPTSIAALVAPCRPMPPIRISPATPSAPSTRAPSASTAASVERVSAASRKPSIELSPSAIAAISAARWEIDLSEGGRRVPRRGPTGSKRVAHAYSPSRTLTEWPRPSIRPTARRACSAPETQTETAPEVMSGAG